MSDEKPKCETCLFWDKDASLPLGKCHRFPAIAMKSGDDWCGEHPKLQSILTPLGKTLTAALGRPKSGK